MPGPLTQASIDLQAAAQAYVRAVREQHRYGATIRDLAVRTGYSKTTIGRMCIGDCQALIVQLWEAPAQELVGQLGLDDLELRERVPSVGQQARCSAGYCLGVCDCPT